MVLKAVKSVPYFKRLYFERLGSKWTENKINAFEQWLNPNDNILDIGCGNGLVSYHLQQKGYDVTPLDVADLSYSNFVQPVVYDGQNIPYPDNHFDVSLLLSVLHHTKDPVQLLQETARVSKHIIINEDVYKNVVQKYLTLFTDTIVNMGFSNMTYQNKSDAEWQQLFPELGIKLKDKKYMKVLLFYLQAVYYLEK